MVTEGDFLDEAMQNVREAIRLCLEDLAEQGRAISDSDEGARLQRVEISIAS